MGNFRLVVNAVGGHGCARSAAKPGDPYFGCGKMSCPDCQFREFVKTLSRTGNNVLDATEIHWPETPQEVKDDVLNGKRISGNF